MIDTKTAIPPDVDAVFREIQCECRHPDGQCSNNARVCIIYHCLGRCTRPEYQPSGENTEFLCMPCFFTFASMIVGEIVRMIAFGHRPECTSCHKPAPNPEAVIREVRPL